MDDTSTDVDWEHYGKTDPYWSVATDERFHKHNLTDDSFRVFFALGEMYVARFFETIHARLDACFTPRRALDFGCGVGRLVLPLARRSEAVVAVDVAESMLREARANCLARGVQNVSFVKSDDDLTGVTGTFDYIQSFVVLQHIPCRRGRRFFQGLTGLLAEGGICVLHLTYSAAALDDSLDSSHSVWPPLPAAAAPSPDGFWHHWTGLRRAVRRRLARTLGARHEAGGVPVPPVLPAAGPADMQMNSYALNPLFHILQQAGVRELHTEFTDHGGYFGMALYFRKQPGTPYRL